jgi:glucose/arabinose dehydrogenase
VELPAEEFFRIHKGDDFGWPYCYYDPFQKSKVQAPEYGGDGKKTTGCDTKKKPIYAFPAHWAPNGLLFYTGDQFPAKYKNGAFIAFHGSWNRAPAPQAGYCVVFLPFKDGMPSGDYEIFADGFAGEKKTPGDANYRPCGLAQGPDGSLYISEDQHGRIWKVTYKE